MKVYINAMSHDRKKALEKLSQNSDDIEKHVAKCVVYGPEFPSYQHWLDELTNWIYRASKLEDSRGRKFDALEYQKNLFGSFGTNTSDSIWALESLHKEVKDLKQYPEFEISHDLVLQLRSAETSIMLDMSDYLSSLGRYCAGDRTLIRRILDNSIRDVWDKDL